MDRDRIKEALIDARLTKMVLALPSIDFIIEAAKRMRAAAAATKQHRLRKYRYRAAENLESWISLRETK